LAGGVVCYTGIDAGVESEGHVVGDVEVGVVDIGVVEFEEGGGRGGVCCAEYSRVAGFVVSHMNSYMTNIYSYIYWEADTRRVNP
jgi:hypothetical protein